MSRAERAERTPLLQRWSDEEEDVRPVHLLRFLNQRKSYRLKYIDPEALGLSGRRPSSVAAMEETRECRRDSHHVQYTPQIHHPCAS